MLSLATLLFTSLLASPLTASATLDDPATPAPHPWFQRFQQLNERAAGLDGCRVVFLGDSITAGWEHDGASVWESFYGARKALNLGVSGDRTQNVLWRMQNGNLAALSPEVAVVLVGVNNIQDDEPAAVAGGVAAILECLAKRCPNTKVLLLGVFPHGAGPGPHRDRVTSLNALLEPMADGGRVHYLDLSATFLSSSGRLSGRYFGDFVHPTELGYELWARAMEPKLAELLGEDPLDLPLPPALQEVRDLALEEIQAFIAEKDLGTRPKTNLPMPPKLTFDDAHRYLWHLNTSVGAIVVQLMPDVAPMHVSSTMYLTELGFYDGISFHRIIPGFMAQGGCPLGTGTGGPGYGYNGEFKDGVVHDRKGLLSMANTGRPKSDGSQFFLTFVPTPHLDGRHTIFGEVIEGLEVLDELEACGSRGGQTTRKLVIEEARIEIVSD